MADHIKAAGHNIKVKVCVVNTVTGINSFSVGSGVNEKSS